MKFLISERQQIKTTSMMSAHISASDRTKLICPIRKCVLPLQNGIYQTNFRSHVFMCLSGNFVKRLNAIIQRCPLGHIMTDNTKPLHKICGMLLASNYSKACGLRILVACWTAIPFAFNEPLLDLKDLHKHTFNIHSTLDQTNETNERFYYLLNQAYLTLKATPQICPVCSDITNLVDKGTNTEEELFEKIQDDSESFTVIPKISSQNIQTQTEPPTEEILDVDFEDFPLPTTDTMIAFLINLENEADKNKKCA